MTDFPGAIRADAILGTALRGAHASYHVEQWIGEGGQGWVFLARYDDPEGAPVVVKVLRPEAASADAIDRFRREAAILQRLGVANPSPFIVRFFDHGEAMLGDHDRVLFTVLEYVRGASLQKVFEETRGAGLAVARVRRIGREVAKALSIVHAQGVVHRDLKPSNVLLTDDVGHETAKVTDFGISKLLDAHATSAQALAGVSLSYAPPEQFEPGNPRVSAATDVFSFAAIVFEALTGAVAFPSSGHPFETLRRIAAGPRPSLRDHLVSAELRDRSAAIAAIDAELSRALAAEPKDRHATIEALWTPIEAALLEAQKAPPIAQATMVPATRRSEHTVPAIALRAPIAPPPAPPAARAIDLSDPRAWTWRVLETRAKTVVKDAVFSGDRVIILTVSGVLAGSAGAWKALDAIPGSSPAETRAIAFDSAIAACGAAGLFATYDGARWSVDRFADADVAFHALAIAGGRAIVVGERVSKRGAFVAERIDGAWKHAFEIEGLGPLRSVAIDGARAFACGDAGALARIEAGRATPIAWAKSGHLRAIAARGGVVLAVGTGGHALSVAGDVVKIERVTTTRDLLGVAIDDEAAWGVSAGARVVRRDREGVWRRITADFAVSVDLLRVAGSHARVRVVGVDGTLLEGSVRE